MLTALVCLARLACLRTVIACCGLALTGAGVSAWLCASDSGGCGRLVDFAFHPTGGGASYQLTNVCANGPDDFTPPAPCTG